MPWTAKDAKQKNKAIRSDKEARMWMKVANKMLAALLEKGVSQEQAESRAIRAANAALKNMHKTGAPTKEAAIMPDTAQLLQEFVDSRNVALRVDREAGVIHGVKVLGYQSRNGRIYPKETMSRAASMYEGVKVNVNHPEVDPKAPRRYEDRIGMLKGVTVGQGNDGLFADLHFNPKHLLAEQLIWDAEHAPGNVGLSHNVAARCGHHNGSTVVEEIKQVVSVDLVADPATTFGLFESDQANAQEENDMPLTELTLKDLQDGRPDLIEQLLEAERASETQQEKDRKIKELTEQVDQLEVAAKLRELHDTIEQELAAANLPEMMLTEVFRKTLQGTADAERRAELIKERQELAKAAKIQKPVSREQQTTEGTIKTTEQFVEAIVE